MGANETGAPVARRKRVLSFHELQQRRVVRILLVSSLYDSFIMSEEGQLHETLLSQFVDLNLSQIPDLTQVTTEREAVEVVTRDAGFDLVITSLRTVDGNAASLVRRLRESGQVVPVIALAYTTRELTEFVADNDTSQLERIFLWQGDVRLLLAMVKYLEDRLNVEQDTLVMGVPVIIVVEDSIRFYSSFLPAIYAELYEYSHHLLSEDLNLSQKMMRMRARPKVLLCETFEEAWNYFERYEEHVLGVISDFQYPMNGELNPEAGLELCTRVQKTRSDIRLVLQSSNADNEARAREIGASFLLKGSQILLQQLRRLLVERFGFGDFSFRLPDGTEIDRAHDLKTLGEKIATVAPESIQYHSAHNHFSNWLKARTEFTLAEKLRPRELSAFDDVEELRRHLVEMISDSRLERHRTVIADFDKDRFEPTVSFTRIGSGSLGGKARGVAFANRVLRNAHVDEEFPGVDIGVPPSVVVGTHVFDEFLSTGGHHEYALTNQPDEEVIKQFVAAPFPRSAISQLRSFLHKVKYPLAVRSSSLLEDSLSQPFAGVYETYMIPNNAIEVSTRWDQLATAIKRVYASAFLAQAKSYLSMTSFRHEEEKMAVMIQELVGTQHGDRFYPDFSGVARSHNFYPEPGHAAEDGVAAVSVGLGHCVVGGGACLRFNPKHPRQIVSFSTVHDALDSSQRELFALDLTRRPAADGRARIERFPLAAAEEDGTLDWLGSTYLADNNSIVDGISRAGVRIVSFAQVLKHDAFPLARLLQLLLERCAEGTGAPVEIEFAGTLPTAGRRARFAFLQLRPLALAKEQEDVTIGEVDDARVICRSGLVLGNGKFDDVLDLVIVDVKRFERARSPEVALQVAAFDATLKKEGRPYVLVGVGRWGSSDPHLGIPVAWNQIAGARVIVEAGLADMRVAPSQGTHFFQNLTSSNVGYFTVNPELGEGVLDWDWLLSLEPSEQTEFVRHCRLDSPLVVKISGMEGEGVILRPGS